MVSSLKTHLSEVRHSPALAAAGSDNSPNRTHSLEANNNNHSRSVVCQFNLWTTRRPSTKMTRRFKFNSTMQSHASSSVHRVKLSIASVATSLLWQRGMAHSTSGSAKEAPMTTKIREVRLTLRSKPMRKHRFSAFHGKSTLWHCF